MKLTNKHNLPEPVVDAVKNDTYNKGKAGYSVTELISPPRIRVLREQHWEELEEDVVDRIWSLMGQLMHLLLERASYKGKLSFGQIQVVLNELQEKGSEIDLSEFFKRLVSLFTAGKLMLEERLFVEISGVRVSGSPDRFEAVTLDEGILDDWKFVTVYKTLHGVPAEYEQQLNMYAYILRKHGVPVTRARLRMPLRDWSKREARREGPPYPPVQFVTMEVPLWPDAKVLAFMEERVRLHEAAKTNLPECTPEERWAKPTKYAVMKKGNKRAINGGLKDGYEEAQALAEGLTQGTGVSHSVEHRPGESIRCQDYCPVAKFCSQWKKIQGGQ